MGKQPVYLKLTNLFTEFFESEKAGGLILVAVTVLSIVLSNSSIVTGYNRFWYSEIGSHTIVHWINDGLMTIFFLLIGLELEREI
jgi:NhaA family Na+:H+ antiporter